MKLSILIIITLLSLSLLAYSKDYKRTDPEIDKEYYQQHHDSRHHRHHDVEQICTDDKDCLKNYFCVNRICTADFHQRRRHHDHHHYLSTSDQEITMIDTTGYKSCVKKENCKNDERCYQVNKCKQGDNNLACRRFCVNTETYSSWD